MKSYLSDTKLKTEFVEEIRKHQKLDQIIQGTYGDGKDDNFKGCAVGCSIESLNRIKGKSYQKDNHKVYETELGVPEWLARLEDTIFEGLPAEKAKKWPLRFSQAIPVGVDLNPVKWQFCAFILSRNIERVLTLDIAEDLREQVVNAIRGVLKLHEDALKEGVWDELTESAARSAESARSAAGSAAESAAGSAERSAERSAEYELYADKLIGFIKATKSSPK